MSFKQNYEERILKIAQAKALYEAIIDLRTLMIEKGYEGTIQNAIDHLQYRVESIEQSIKELQIGEINGYTKTN